MRYFLFNPLGKPNKQLLVIGRFYNLKTRFVFYTHNHRFPVAADWRRHIDTICSIGGSIMDENGNVLYPDEFWSYIDHMQYHSNARRMISGQWQFKFFGNATLHIDEEGYNLATLPPKPKSVENPNLTANRGATNASATV